MSALVHSHVVIRDSRPCLSQRARTSLIVNRLLKDSKFKNANCSTSELKQTKLSHPLALAPNELKVLKKSPFSKIASRFSQLTKSYYGGMPTSTDRVISCLPYLLPICSSVRYGRFLYPQFPALSQLFLSVLQPLLHVMYSVPFGATIVFFAIYLGIVKNQTRFSRFVRFAALQALLLDIILILPALVEQAIRPPSYGWGFTVYSGIHSMVWLATMGLVIFIVYKNILGQKPNVPFIGEAVDQQLA
mmetsp:Transcript_32147/g.44574  ORF Transcript_32147/g.44574 Transcript_32147/m.44574 type:complete len:246 (+) Transcript_32147:138-875(+)